LHRACASISVAAAVPTAAPVVQFPVTGDGAEPASGVFLGKTAGANCCCSSYGSGRSPATTAVRARSRFSWTRLDVFYLCAALLALHGLCKVCILASDACIGVLVDVLVSRSTS
jgi:hypothetical protein